jgi:hypothetical protein
MEITRINYHLPLPVIVAILIVLGLIIYALKGFQPVLALPVLGAVIIIAGINEKGTFPYIHYLNCIDLSELAFKEYMN